MTLPAARQRTSPPAESGRSRVEELRLPELLHQRLGLRFDFGLGVVGTGGVGGFGGRNTPVLRCLAIGVSPSGCCPACPSRTGRRGSPRRAGSPRPPRGGSPGCPRSSPPA